jgi:N-acetylmuramoyl-L-alanine amidase
MRSLAIALCSLFISNAVHAVSEKDVKCLARNIYYEARGESIKAQIAVANVTINRTKHSKYPDSICRVVYQPHQFSWTTRYKRPHESKVDIVAWRLAVKIARNAIRGKYGDVTKGSTHYHNVRVRPRWANSKKIRRVARIDKHVFYRKPNV